MSLSHFRIEYRISANIKLIEKPNLNSAARNFACINLSVLLRIVCVNLYVYLLASFKTEELNFEHSVEYSPYSFLG